MEAHTCNSTKASLSFITIHTSVHNSFEHFETFIDWISSEQVWESGSKMVKGRNVEDRDGFDETILQANI